MKINKTLPPNIQDLLLKAVDYFNNHHKIIFAYLFGGLVKGRVLPLSDIDIAVYLTESSDFQGIKIELLSKLADILETEEIDLVILNNTTSVPLMGRIIENKNILVDKNPFIRHKVESLILRKFFDFSVKEKAIYKRRYSIG